MRKTMLIIIISAVAFLLILLGLLIADRVSKIDTSTVTWESGAGNNDESGEQKLLERLGYRIRIGREPSDRLKITCLIRDVPLSEDIQSDLEDWLGEGKRLIAFPDVTYDYFKSKTYHITKGEGWLSGISDIYMNEDARLAKKIKLFGMEFTVEPVLKEGDAIKIGTIRYKGTTIILIPDRDLFENINLLTLDNALLLNNVLKDKYPGPVLIDYSGSDKKVPESPPFLLTGSFPFLLFQFLLLILALYLMVWKRLGQPLDLEKYQRRSVLQHIRLVGGFFEKTRKESLISSILDEYFFEKLYSLVPISSRENYIEEVKKRFQDIIPDSEIFERNRTAKLEELEAKRQAFLHKLEKGEANGN